jgi:ribosome maturation factor RimP
VATGLPSQTQVIELLDAEFARAGYEIEDVAIDTGSRPPRITVIADGDNALDLDTIAALSRSASKLLDGLDGLDGPEDPARPDNAAGPAGPYVLEVTSPGVERPLTCEKHFRRAEGRKVDVTLSDGSQLTGHVGGVRGDEVVLVVREHPRSAWTRRGIPLDSIVKAVVQVDFSPPSKQELELSGQTDDAMGTEAGR